MTYLKNINIFVSGFYFLIGLIFSGFGYVLIQSKSQGHYSLSNNFYLSVIMYLSIFLIPLILSVILYIQINNNRNFFQNEKFLPYKLFKGHKQAGLLIGLFLFIMLIIIVTQHLLENYVSNQINVIHEIFWICLSFFIPYLIILYYNTVIINNQDVINKNNRNLIINFILIIILIICFILLFFLSLYFLIMMNDTYFNNLN